MSHAADNLRLIVTSDQEGYFQYLPFFFIKGDLQHLPYAGVLPNGNTLNIYHIGVAVLEAPFFIIAHVYALAFDYDPTGYTKPYLLGIFAAAAFYLTLACYLLTELITLHFNRLTALITVSILFLGTNLLYYSSHEAGMSHVYSFFLFSLFLYQIEGFLESLSVKRCIYMGLTLGLITIVRPNNLILGLCIPLWGVSSFADVKTRLALLFSKPFKLLIVVLSFCTAIMPQLLYWNLVTESFFVFSYGEAGQGFNWTSPELLKVLFSPQNGWLIYSPIMILSLIGLSMTLRRCTHNSLAVFTVIVIAYYIFSSWWAWWFGAAFGHRAFVDYYALLSLPMAYTLNQVIQHGSQVLKGGLTILIFLAIYVNIKMSFLYNPPWDGPEWGWDDYGNIIRAIF